MQRRSGLGELRPRQGATMRFGFKLDKKIKISWFIGNTERVEQVGCVVLVVNLKSCPSGNTHSENNKQLYIF